MGAAGVCLEIRIRDKNRSTCPYGSSSCAADGKRVAAGVSTKGIPFWIQHRVDLFIFAPMISRR